MTYLGAGQDIADFVGDVVNRANGRLQRCIVIIKGDDLDQEKYLSFDRFLSQEGGT